MDHFPLRHMVDMMPTEAEPAWNAYLAMDKSKQAHFNLLERLEKKYHDGGMRTLSEQAELESLLAEHSERVQHFRRLTKVLQTTDLAAHQALIAQITMINSDSGPDKRPV